MVTVKDGRTAGKSMVCRQAGEGFDLPGQRGSSGHPTPTSIWLVGVVVSGAAAAAPAEGPPGGRVRLAQAKVSAISAWNQVCICSNWSAFHPSDALEAAVTGVISLVAGSYWNTAVSQLALLIVIVE